MSIQLITNWPNHNQNTMNNNQPPTSSINFGPIANDDVENQSPLNTILSHGYRQSESGTIIISPYLEKNMGLWVWDFDDTLIDLNAYKRHNMDPDIIRQYLTDAELTIDIPNWGYFKKLVQYLVATGKRVGIASFGTYSIIKAYMDRIFGPSQKYFGPNNLLATCPEIGCNRSCIDMPLNKNAYILKMMKFYRIQGYESVVLFDDSSSNIADALRIGINAFQIDESTGLFGAQIMFMIEAKIQYKCETDVCGSKSESSSESLFGSLGDRKRWKYDAQAYNDIFNRVLKASRVDPSANISQTTNPITSTTTMNTSTTGMVEGFENGKRNQYTQDICVTCRAGHELWVIGIIMALVIGIIIIMII